MANAVVWLVVHHQTTKMEEYKINVFYEAQHSRLLYYHCY